MRYHQNRGNETIGRRYRRHFGIGPALEVGHNDPRLLRMQLHAQLFQDSAGRVHCRVRFCRRFAGDHLCRHTLLDLSGAVACDRNLCRVQCGFNSFRADVRLIVFAKLGFVCSWGAIPDEGRFARTPLRA